MHPVSPLFKEQSNLCAWLHARLVGILTPINELPSSKPQRKHTCLNKILSLILFKVWFLSFISLQKNISLFFQESLRIKAAYLLLEL